jgi:hypothetical protein
MEVDYWAKGIFKAAIGGPISDRQLKRIRKKVGAKTRRSKKKRKLKPGEDSECGIVLFGEEAKAAAAAWEASSNPKSYFCHVNRSWLTE